MTPKIVFEDDSLFVVDKPSGLVVNRAETTSRIETLQDWIERKFKIENLKLKIPQTEFAARSGIVHRLDKDTSGLLVIAKTPEAFENLKNQFKSREVEKIYLALVHGNVSPAQGTIRAPIERSPFNRKHFGVFPGGRAAVTSYKSYKSYKSYTLLELTPHTGRTHQIRVHLKYLGHPVVSDPLYAGRKTARADLKFCPRLFLHAKSLTFKHPKTGKPLAFNSPLPADLSSALSRLEPLDK